MKILAITLFLLTAINCYSQITTIEVQTKEKPIEIQKYDSLESLTYENAPLHEGQTLFIKGDSYSKKENGFYDFFYTKMVSDLEYPYDEKEIYKPITISSTLAGKTYKRIVSNYSDFIGKYYKIMSIETDSTFGKAKHWFKLIGDDQNPFYLKVASYTHLDEVVTLGHYEKMKQIFVGKEFYVQGEHIYEKVDSKDEVSAPSLTIFKCIDIGVNIGEDEPIFAILENEKYGKIKGEILEGRELKNFISTEKYNGFIQKYGERFGPSVAEGAVETGMSVSMVLDAVGKPNHINTTKSNNKSYQQWVYGDVYLYFENGILTSLQY